MAESSLDGGFYGPVRRRWGRRSEDFVLGDGEGRKGTPAVGGRCFGLGSHRMYQR